RKQPKRRCSMPAPDRKRRLTAFLVALAVLVATPLAVVAADAFTDVPDTNVFHDDIAWLEASGVTKGCNPPDNTEFCPGDNVTREQMSAFMRRLAQYIDAEDGTPALADHATTAGDADTLDGTDSSGFVEEGEADSVTPAMTSAEPGVAQITSGDFPQLDGTVQNIDSISINAPAAGYAIVTLTSEVWMHHTTGTKTEIHVGVSASPTAFANAEDHDVQTPSGAPTGSYVQTVGVTKAFPVTAGPNTFHFLAERVTGAPLNSQVGDYTITATYVASSYGDIELASTTNDSSDGE
ncbi:MAG TPA: S-layer homology domain-containing protein, partial [Acidimicrobiia bacterium]|nr:S-layer homology domain-containing protein [Acidimicrobiia bacterium]